VILYYRWIAVAAQLDTGELKGGSGLINAQRVEWHGVAKQRSPAQKSQHPEPCNRQCHPD